MGAVKQHFHDEICARADDSDYDFYASLVADRDAAFAYRNALQAASSPTHRTPDQEAEIAYAIRICDIANTRTT